MFHVHLPWSAFVLAATMLTKCFAAFRVKISRESCELTCPSSSRAAPVSLAVRLLSNSCAATLLTHLSCSRFVAICATALRLMCSDHSMRRCSVSLHAVSAVVQPLCGSMQVPCGSLAAAMLMQLSCTDCTGLFLAAVKFLCSYHALAGSMQLPCSFLRAALRSFQCQGPSVRMRLSCACSCRAAPVYRTVQLPLGMCSIHAHTAVLPLHAAVSAAALLSKCQYHAHAAVMHVLVICSTAHVKLPGFCCCRAAPLHLSLQRLSGSCVISSS